MNTTNPSPSPETEREAMAGAFFEAGESNRHLSAKAFQLGWEARASFKPAAPQGVDSPLPVPSDHLRPPGGEKYDDPRYEEFGLTADHVCRMWARYVDQTHPPGPEIARLIVGVTSDVYRAALSAPSAVEALRELVAHGPNLPVSIQPLYYVRHPDDTYSVADPQPVQTTGGKGS